MNSRLLKWLLIGWFSISALTGCYVHRDRDYYYHDRDRDHGYYHDRDDSHHYDRDDMQHRY